jgi:hypothetical protein
MIRWLRVVWPPWWALALAVLCFLLLQAPFLLLEFGQRASFFSIRDVEAQRAFVALTGVYAILYAVFRIAAFHPAVRPEYRRWLSASPWTSRKPLPLGPIHLVWQDLLLLTLAVAMGWPRLQWQTFIFLQVFFGTFLFGLGVLQVSLGARGWAYGVGCGIGFMVLFTFNPFPFFVTATATYVLAYLGLRASLARFPWENPPVVQPEEILANRAKSQNDLGWPYDRLGPNRCNDYRIDLHDVLLIGALAGWWFFVVDYHFRLLPDASHGRYLVFCVLMSLGVVIRLGVYCYGYSPPLNLLARLVHGKWIIPDYDQVFVAPLLAILVATAAGALARWGIDSFWTMPIAFAVTWWVLLGLGPSLPAWRLTGNHRIVPGLASAGTVKG